MGWMGVVTRVPFEVSCWEIARVLGLRRLGLIFVRVVFFALRLAIPTGVVPPHGATLKLSWQRSRGQ